MCNKTEQENAKNNDRLQTKLMKTIWKTCEELLGEAEIGQLRPSYWQMMMAFMMMMMMITSHKEQFTWTLLDVTAV
jgi:hypothetical protein